MHAFAVACFCFGVLSITYSVFPYAQAMYSGNNTKVARTILTSNNEDNTVALNKETRSGEYNNNVNKNFENTNKALESQGISHPELAGESGEMKLTIQKLGLKNLPVVVNVNSYEENTYMPILDTKLAHFKGTSLPSSNGNTFIYGHSTNELWARTNPTHPQIAFTYLNKMDIGDEINLEFKGKTYKYILQKVRTVSPDDVSPIFSYGDKKTLTLMTCWPPGVGTERLILIADQQ